MVGRVMIVAATLIATVLMTNVGWAAVTLTGAGATFPQPIYNKWFHDFHARNPNIQVNYQGIGSGGGIKAFKDGTVDFAGSDAPMTDAELATLPGGRAFQMPTVGGAVAVAYNLPGFSKPLRLSRTSLVGIYMGTITRWNDARIRADNPGVALPNRPVTVIHRSDGSGTTYLFTSYLSAVDATWKSKVGAGKEVNWPVGKGGKGNPGVAGLVKQIPGAIGYMEVAYATQNRLPTAALKNRAGVFVKPTVAATTAAIRGAIPRLKEDIRASIVNPSGRDAYPIAGLTYLIFYQKQTNREKGQALQKLLTYCITTGQGSAASLHYAPLPSELVAIAKNMIAQLQIP